MVIALVNARLLTPDEEIPRAIVILGEGRIARGFDTDLEALDEGLELAMTFVGGDRPSAGSKAQSSRRRSPRFSAPV